MSESAKQLVEEAQKAAQGGDQDGMLYSRLADCIERLLAERAALAGHVENIDTALEAIRELTDAEP
jgi:hypothetical protein